MDKSKTGKVDLDRFC